MKLCELWCRRVGPNGVDVFCKSSNTQVASSGFYNMLDLAVVNAYILYKACTEWTGKRRLFLSLLAKEPRCRFMQHKEILAQRQAAAAAVPGTAQTIQCQVQESCNRNRSRFTCAKCRDDGHWVCKRCKV